MTEHERDVIRRGIDKAATHFRLTEASKGMAALSATRSPAQALICYAAILRSFNQMPEFKGPRTVRIINSTK